MLHKMHFKVMMWLDSRDFQKKDRLQEVNDFVIVSDELESEFDRFKERFDSGVYYVPVNDLLFYWHQTANPTAVVHVEFGKEYFLMNQDQLDQFYLWIEHSRDEQTIKSIYEVRGIFFNSMCTLCTIL